VTGDSSHRSGTGVADALTTADLVRRVLQELEPAFRRIARDEADRLQAQPRRWATKPDVRRLGYPYAPSTLRALQAEGVLTRGRRGMVCIAELEKLMASGAPAAKPAQPADLAAERARRVAAELKGAK
jgi:hypothetical protein